MRKYAYVCVCMPMRVYLFVSFVCQSFYDMGLYIMCIAMTAHVTVICVLVHVRLYVCVCEGLHISVCVCVSLSVSLYLCMHIFM